MGDQEWEVDVGGSRYRADLETLSRWIRQGRITAETKVRKGELNWVPVGLAPQLREIHRDELQAEDLLLEQARASLPQVLAPEVQCPRCSAPTPTSSPRCTACGRPWIGEDWRRFVATYTQSDQPTRTRFWSALEPEGRVLLQALLNDSAAQLDMGAFARSAGAMQPWERYYAVARLSPRDRRVFWSEWEHAGYPSPPRCHVCEDRLLQLTEPDRAAANTGCIVFILGAVLAPILIGIPLIIWGLVMRSSVKPVLKCANGMCGATVPA